ncbi:MAG: hypothetical protein RLZZ303_3435 [Candidatus Hydrogenedentota bacterium]
MGGKLHDIDSLLDEVVTLPSMPTALEQVVSLMDSPDASMSDVAKAISADPAIALKAMRLVNSAYYGLGQEVKTVDHAVVLLGGRVVRNLVLTASVFNVIEGVAERFVRHAIGCGVAMRIMARHGSASALLDSPDEGFVFGLLHEIGKVLLNEFMPEESSEVSALVQGGALPHLAERQVIGVDHAEIGARLAERWHLSPSIVDALQGQYDLNRTSPAHRPLAAGLQLSNFMAEASGYTSEAKASAVLEPGILGVAGLGAAELPVILEQYFASHGEISDLLSLAG